LCASADAVQRALIIVGVVLVAVGLLWPWLGRLPFSRLPGDIAVRREQFSLYVPITSMVLLSLLLSADRLAVSPLTPVRRCFTTAVGGAWYLSAPSGRPNEIDDALLRLPRLEQPAGRNNFEHWRRSTSSRRRGSW